ncbi:TPA: aspartate--tRNA(Asn) ligase [Candidatus Falkowbacteria bacterium]|nr:MAG: Aspartyl-tRNA synthetase [Candidatus Falkowbacteria bacterium GW2011_GWF2_43_32]HBA36994.1 aspartate--tRNA(Asn) ligase [Candidatus Falkowbacteria bacterium]
MSRILITDAKKQETGEVTVSGWVRNLRAHKGLVFVDLTDISGTMQIVFAAGQGGYELAEKLTLESVVEVTGNLQAKPTKKNDPNPIKDFELAATDARLISLAKENLPIPVLTKADNEANLENRLDWRWLDLRPAEHQLIFKVWTKLEEGCREYWLKNNFIQIYTPCLMSTASESGAEVFAVKYFDRSAYLAQSPQFYKQMAMASGLEKVFMVGTVFRAELSFTTRHVTEFTGWDMEVSYASYLDIMSMQEDLLISGFEKVREALGSQFEITVPAKPFPKITLAEAKEKLRAAGIKGEKDWDFSTEEEKELGAIIKKETGHDFVFVTDYPIAARPFYHRRHEDNPGLTKSFDLLYRGLEITTGSEREHRIEVLEKQAVDKGMNLEELKDYLNFFRYGCPEHSGIGMGPGRIIMKMLGLNSVKEACFLPRDVKRLTP